MATKRKRGSTWHYTVRRSGLLEKPLYLSFEDEREGDEYVRRLEALLDRGVVPDEFQDKREVKRELRAHVREFLKANTVTADDASILQNILARLPKTPALTLPDLTFTWATAWTLELKRVHNLAPSTVRKYVGALARVLDWVTAHGDIPFNPLRMLPKGYANYTDEDALAVKRVDGEVKDDVERDRRLEPGRPGGKSEEERIRAILDKAKPDGRQRPLELREAAALALLFDMALESAMRMREMYTLSRRQIDLPRRTIFLDRTKNGSKRQVPISSVLAARLEPYLEGMEPDDLVFPWWDGDLTRAALKRQTSQLSRQFGRIFEAAACDDLHFHDLRHEATSRLFERTTLTDIQIANITGHKDPRSLKRYANLRASNLAARMW